MSCQFVVAQDFVVRNYSAEITLLEEGYFDVIERYRVEFLRPRRGIYRVIQTNYDFEGPYGARQKRRIKISNIQVPGHRFDAPSDFGQKYSDQLQIRIGDPNRYIEGYVDYEIRYRVENAFIFREDGIQFYWNIKNDGWPTDFENISFKINAPQGVYLSSDNCFVYSGPRDITARTTDFELSYGQSVFEGSNRDGYVSIPKHNLTVLINLPPGSVAEIKPAFPFLTNYGWTLLILGLIGGFYSIWRRYGKDDELPATTSYYPPKNMDPAMAGYLINDHYDYNDLVSLIPHWGSQGLLRIEEIDPKGWFKSKDTKIIKLKELPATSSNYEQKMFGDLFSSTYMDDETMAEEVLVSNLKNKFYQTIGTASSQLKKASRIYYDKQSIKVRNWIYFFLILFGIIFTILSLFLWNILAAILTAITCIVLLVMNFFMIKKNRAGNEAFSELKGFRQFIKIAEKNKLSMLLKEDTNYFESTMAYALAFGMFDKWAGKFKDLNVPPPSWYHSTSGATHASMTDFSKSFSSSMSSVTSNMVSSPSSSGGGSGGGSSGGGFGGGGGGSW